MKASDLRNKTNTELNALLVDLSKEQFNLRMQKGLGQLTKSSQVKQNRRDIARINTILGEASRAQ